MTDHLVSGRFDVHATGELSGSFDSAEERARLLNALNADRDLCSALLCGEQQLLCRGVEWEQARAFAALMRDCGVVTQVVQHGEQANAAVDREPIELSLVEVEETKPEPESAVTLQLVVDDIPNIESAPPLAKIERDSSNGGNGRGQAPLRAGRAPDIYEAEEVESLSSSTEPPPSRPNGKTETVVTGDADIPVYLLEADARERNERRRQQRRWGLASLMVLGVTLIFAFSGGGEQSFSSQQAYVHLLANTVHAGANGVVAELLVEPGQRLERGEAVAVIAPDGNAALRRIEVAPAAGTVDQIGVKVGQRVQSDDLLLTLARPGSAYLLVYFTPEQLHELPSRAVVQINLDNFPGQPVLGRLADRPAVASTPTDSVARSAVRIDFEDELPLLQRLRSGMAASVTIRQSQDAE